MILKAYDLLYSNVTSLCCSEIVRYRGDRPSCLHLNVKDWYVLFGLVN